MQRNNKPKNMPRKLEKAVKTNNVALVKEILDTKKFQDPQWMNAVNGRGRTALLLAMKYKSWDVAKLLLTYPNTDVNAVDREGKTALVSQVKNIEIVNLLLDDVRLNTLKYKHAEILFETWRYNEVHFLALLQKLIAKGFPVNTPIYDGEPALSWACRRNQMSVLKFLLAQPGIDVNRSNILREMLSHHHHLDVVKLLLADPRIRVNGRTKHHVDSPMGSVMQWGWTQDVRQKLCIKAILCHPKLDPVWLRERGSEFFLWLNSVNQKTFAQVINLDSTDISAIERQYQFQFTIVLAEVIDVLINDPDFDINARYYNGQTLLTMAISEGMDKIVNQLLACPRIDLHRQDKFGHSALTQADKSGKPDLVTTIMQHPRFKLLATYHHDQNLLMHAAENDCVDLTKRILELNEFPIDQVDAHGDTALNLLAQHHKNQQDASLFLAFVTHGADPTLRNHLGSNAIMSAENNNLKGIASDLKNFVKDTVQSASWNNPEPSAPPMPMSEDANGLDNVEAQQPPQRYYEHGLFGGSAPVSAPPQQENLAQGSSSMNSYISK